MAIIQARGLGALRTIQVDDRRRSIIPDASRAPLSLVSRPLAVGARGFDTSEKLTAAQYRWAKANGFDFVVRYAPLAGQNPAVGIDSVELAGAVGSGLGVMIVQFSRTTGLTQENGHADGAMLAAFCRNLLLPVDMCVWGDFSPADAGVMQTYGNTLYAAAASGGISAGAFGGYNEPGVPADFDLRTDYTFHRYWRTNGQVPEVDGRGYELTQLFPGNVTVGAPGETFLIDYDFAGSDWLGSYPVAAYAAAA
jgi:hypothetical protein